MKHHAPTLRRRRSGSSRRTVSSPTAASRAVLSSRRAFLTGRSVASRYVSTVLIGTNLPFGTNALMVSYGTRKALPDIYGCGRAVAAGERPGALVAGDQRVRGRCLWRALRAVFGPSVRALLHSHRLLVDGRGSHLGGVPRGMAAARRDSVQR